MKQELKYHSVVSGAEKHKSLKKIVISNHVRILFLVRLRQNYGTKITLGGRLSHSPA